MSGKKKRKRRDLARLERGLKPRTSIDDRRKVSASNIRQESATEQAGKGESVFSRHGLILPPQATGRLVLARRK